VVGRPDEIKGQGAFCFVTVKQGVKADYALRDALKKHVRTMIGPVATPDAIGFAEALPKTRSGKIMRRLLKQIAAGNAVTGDPTTLEDFSILAKLGSAEAGAARFRSWRRARRWVSGSFMASLGGGQFFSGVWRRHA
jgi:acetyl-CoA synthetase